MTEFPCAMFNSYLLFTLCICFTTQVTASFPYTDPNEQYRLNVKGLDISSPQSLAPSQSQMDISSDNIDKGELIVNPHGNSAM